MNYFHIQQKNYFHSTEELFLFNQIVIKYTVNET